MKYKHETNILMYLTNKQRISYLLSFMKVPIFQVIHAWVAENKSITWDTLFDQVKYYMRGHLQTTDIQ